MDFLLRKKTVDYPMPCSSRGARLKYGAVFTFYCRRCICLQAVLRVNEYSVEPHLLGLTGAGKIAYGACQGRRDKAVLREDCFWKIVEAAYAARARIFFLPVLLNPTRRLGMAMGIRNRNSMGFYSIRVRI